MKRLVSILLAVLMIGTFAVFALGSGDTESSTSSQGSGEAESASKADDEIGDYSVVIDSFRLAKSYDGSPVVIVKYVFTNNNDTATAFFTAFSDTVYQDGVGLNEAYLLDDSANYDSGNQTKEIKKGASLDVEVAYELNDTETDIEVEIKELFSFDDTVITKSFTIK